MITGDNELFSVKMLQLIRRLKIFLLCRYSILITTHDFSQYSQQPCEGEDVARNMILIL